MQDPQHAVVVIGRNEGERLRRCLESVIGIVRLVVYVDSGSSDDSVRVAKLLGAEVVELDGSIPFTAARARNTGFNAITQLGGPTSFVQFVDGDCELDPKWIGTALATLLARPDVAVVSGRLSERNAEVSMYNRLCEMEPAAGRDGCLWRHRHGEDVSLR